METGLERIGELLHTHPERRLDTLMHLVNRESLEQAHKNQPTGKAVGVDSMTKTEYGENLRENLDNLIQRMKTFSYRPQPVLRTYIPKEGGGGKLRPLGIPAYEDKLVQGVMAEILKAIYEPKFYNFSYGYRENKGCHKALRYLGMELGKQVNWVVDADIRGFFDNVSHEWMMKFLEHDIADKNFLRYIRRFMKAGMMEQGKFLETDKGVAQGGLISPVMANVYLHYALDMWFDKVVTKKCAGHASMIRYADDAVFCFQRKEDAETFYTALKERLAKFELEVAEEKTKIIPFGRYAANAETFDFLGFTIISGKTRRGYFVVKYHTSKKKLRAKRQAVKFWLRQNMHLPIPLLIKRLNLKLGGHYNYYGVTHNAKKLVDFNQYVRWQLLRTLRRRSQRDKTNWERFDRIMQFNPLLPPRLRVNLYEVIA